MRWGLIPSWCKDIKQLGLSTINAKAETILQRTVWAQPFKKRRCIIPASGTGKTHSNAIHAYSPGPTTTTCIGLMVASTTNRPSAAP
jgi:putative SOS response-associated peptidase YedK